MSVLNVLMFCLAGFFAGGAVSFHSAAVSAFKGSGALKREKAPAQSETDKSGAKPAKKQKPSAGDDLPAPDQIPPQQSTKDYLIEKLDYLNRTLPKDHKARHPLLLRQAHILSLRAEELFIKAERENCSSCGKKARLLAQRSLSAYQAIDALLSARHPILHAKSLFKQAYLHRLLSERSLSAAKLRQIAGKKKIDPLLMARAWFNLGEIHFEMYDYKKSLHAFKEALKRGHSPWRLKAIYRKIWSLSNLSLYDQSVNELEAFLKSDLYSDPSLSLSDQKLKQKLEGELIALYHYAPVTDRRLAFLYNFSKHNQKKNTPAEKNKRLFDLAKALNRIGRRSASNRVWLLYLSKISAVEERLKADYFMVDNDLNMSKINLLRDTGPKIERIFAGQAKVKISESFKQELKAQAKRFFNQIYPQASSLSESQTQRLLDLQERYNFIYPGDGDVLSRSAVLAQNLNQYALAQNLFQKAVLHLRSDGDTAERTAKIRENMSLLQIEMAELSGSPAKQLSAYDFYIKHGANESWVYKAKYQKAYISYKNKEYKKAAENFKNLALSQLKANPSKELRQLCLKSAHLSLSALSRMGQQEEELVRWAGRFMREFPQNRGEFIRIYHTALLNTVKKLVSNKDFSHRPIQASSDKHILKAWKTLNLVSVKEATKAEALAYHLNRLLLAKELLKFESMDQSIRDLLTAKNLKKEDQKTALTWKLWLADLRFDFKEALRIVKILQADDQSEERLLRLAHLAKLSGESPIPYYKSFIEKFPRSQSAISVLTSMVEAGSGGNKKNILKKYAKLFKSQPDTLAYLILQTDQGRLDEKFIQPFVSLEFMRGSSLASFMRRKQIIESFEKDLIPVSHYSLPAGASDYKLRRAIKNYSHKIEQFSRRAEKALSTRDWTARVFIASHWKRETARFYNSIKGLSLPKGLTEEEKKEYIKLLHKRLAPYQEQISRLENEINSLWSRDFLASYEKNIQQNSVFSAPLKWEMEKLLAVSKKENKRQLKLLLLSLKTSAPAQKTVKQDNNQIQFLYKALQKNPFDKKSLVKLLELEKTRNNEVLSYYLVNRIKELKKRGQGIKL